MDNLPTDTHGLDKPDDLLSYFAIFRDESKRKLMAFRRAAQFKGVVKKHLITFMRDALHIVEDDLFKLDTDFDFLIYDDKAFIWRPSGFTFMAEIDEQLAASAAANVSVIAKDMQKVDFAPILKFVATHKKAMRLVAALKSRGDLGTVSLALLEKNCKANGVEFTKPGGKLTPKAGSEYQFLEVLDRRLYTVTLVQSTPETYEAASRSQLVRPKGP